MNKYHVIHRDRAHADGVETPAEPGAQGEVYLTAADLPTALALAAERHPGRPIVSVRLAEPLVERPADLRERVVRCLENDMGRNADEFEDYESHDFVPWVSDITTVLRDEDIAPDLSVSFISDWEGPVTYATVGRGTSVLGQYRSTGVELKHLTDDRAAVGVEGVMAVVECLLGWYDTLR